MIVPSSDGKVYRWNIGAHYLYGDNLGSKRLAANSSGSAVAGATGNYKPFGEPTSGALDGLTGYAFTGQHRDISLNLQYHRARWLNCTTAVWLSADPVWDFAGNFGNAFAALGQNWVNNVDPSGTMLDGTMLNIVMTAAIIGGLAGGLIGGLRDGVWGAVRGIVAGAALGALFTFVAIEAGTAIAALVFEIWGAGILSAQVAVWAVSMLISSFFVDDVITDATDAYYGIGSPGQKAAAWLTVLIVAVGFIVGLRATHKSGNSSQAANKMIRREYVNREMALKEQNAQWKKEGVSALERARRCWQSRRNVRNEMRDQMNPLESETLKKRDFLKYGDREGPTFEQLVEKARESGKTGDAVYESICESASRSNAKVNARVLKE